MRTTAFGPENGPDTLVHPMDRIRVDDIGSPIRQLMGQFPIVETGTVQFGDDWPGVFIRGDNAAWYAMQLRNLLDKMGCEEHRPEDWNVFHGLHGLLEVLESSRVQPAP